VLPLDRFAVRDGRLEFEDLAATHFGSEQAYTVEWSIFNNTTAARTPIAGATTFQVPTAGAAYLVAQIRGERPGQEVYVYLRDGRQVVGREMTGSLAARDKKLEPKARSPLTAAAR
jgi:hypothetical protein